MKKYILYITAILMLFSSTARAYGFDDELYNKVPIECRDRNEDINIQAMCLKEHFFFGGNPVHPKIIEDMISGIDTIQLTQFVPPFLHADQFSEKSFHRSRAPGHR